MKRKRHYLESDLLSLKQTVLELQISMNQRPQFIYAAFYFDEIQLAFHEIIFLKTSKFYLKFKEIIDWLLDESSKLYAEIIRTR